MIISENFTIGGREFIKRYSDGSYYIRKDQTGAEHSEAIDVSESEYTYTETDKPIETDGASEVEQKAAAWDELTGGGANE